jgi:hypothetical protein
MKTVLIALDEIRTESVHEKYCKELVQLLIDNHEVHVMAENIALNEIGEYLRMKGVIMHPRRTAVSGSIPTEYDVIVALDQWGTENSANFVASMKIVVKEGTPAQKIANFIIEAKVKTPEEKIAAKKDIGKKITVVIPIRKGGNAKITKESLKNQTITGMKIVEVRDLQSKGANWARNKGFEQVTTEYVLFSDDDIQWEPDALESMLDPLEKVAPVSYAYGSYEMDGQIQCDKEFNPAVLKQTNFISTMTLIRAKDFPGFDEKIKRLQDWDLWLTMLEQGNYGVYIGKKIFTTEKRDGITDGKDAFPYQKALDIVKKKHGL